MIKNNPAPITNYKVMQMLDRVLNDIPHEEQLKLVDTPRLNQLFNDRVKAIQGHQFLKAQIIDRQYKAAQEDILYRHALKLMS